MKCSFVLLLLAGAAVADYDHGWKTGNEYQYLVRSRTLTGIPELREQYAGVLIKGVLTVQAGSEGSLQARFSNARYAHVHTELPEGVDSVISDELLEYRDLPISGSSFEIKSKHGVIKDLVVDKTVPTWELNLLKSIVSQMQVDTQGENAWHTGDSQIPMDGDVHASFRAMEDSVGGKCEVRYDIVPLPSYVLHSMPELVPIPELKGEGEHIDVIKSKNYSRCEQRMGYHYGVTGRTNWEPGSNGNGDFMSKSSTSRIVISGSLKSFTIQSSVTTNKMYVALRINEEQPGVVYAKMNLTLAKYSKISKPIPPPSNGESSGNLVYAYNDPFSETDLRKPRRPDPGFNSVASLSSSMSAASSSEERHAGHAHAASSPSSSASSSSISSSEENDFWQPKPGLTEPPLSPLLPYFVGYKGKAIGASAKVDTVAATKDLVTQIAMELEDPNGIPTQGTLDKYSILAKLIRTMSAKEIARVAEESVHSSSYRVKDDKDAAGKERQNGWSVFRDAVVQAGTGPAFLTIKDWIESGKMEGFEAAEAMSRISRTARMPTSEYMDAFFELIGNPKVMNQRFLNDTAVLAFADLVRYSQICNSTIHNRYPVHSFGRMSSKHNQAVFDKYIPFLAREMRHAIKEGNSPKAQVYTMALGNIGHPKILSVYESYLEGKDRATTFQRLMMVMSMGKMADLYPKIARSVLYKIYLNTEESYEIRCMAVYLLMKTNPPLSMLQRMADFTNYDFNRHVNSAVQSTIRGIAALQGPEYAEMATKARNAEKLLNPLEYSYQYSKNYIQDAIPGGSKLSYKMIVNYIGSDDSVLPRDWYMGVESSFGGFKPPITEFLAMVSSAKDLFELNPFEEEDDSGESPTEKLVKLLNIRPQKTEPLEGNILQNSEYASRFMPYDEDTLQTLSTIIVGKLKTLGSGQYVSATQMSSYEMTVSFPTETGFPFVYTFKSPTALKLSGTAKIDDIDESGVGGKAQFRLLFSRKVQGRAGFVTPFEHQHFMSGVDMNAQVYLPGKIQVRLNGPKNSLQVKLQTINNEPKARIFHFSVVPYTAKYEILSLRPVLLEKNTYVVHVEEPESTVMAYPNKGVSAFRLEAEADELTTENFLSFDSEDPFEVMISPWCQYDLKYRKMDIYIKPEFNDDESLSITATYDATQESSDSSQSENWSLKSKAPEPVDSKPNSENRRKQFLEEAAKGINSPRSSVLDLEVELPGQFKNRHAVTLAWARSNVDDKSRALLYWHVDFFERDFTYEVCAAGQAKVPWTPLWNYEKAINGRAVNEFDSDIRYGPTCASGGKVSVRAKQSQSKEMNDMVRESAIVKLCERQIKEGNKALPACQKASAKALTLDETDISIRLDSKILRILANRGIDMLKNLAYPDISVNAFNPKNLDQDRIDVRLKLSTDMRTADLTIYTPDMDVTFTDIDLSDFDLGDESSLLATSNSMDMRTLADEQDQLACILDYNEIATFDGRSYPLKLGKCSHVLMTATPKEDAKDSKKIARIPKHMRASVMSEETGEGGKLVKIALGENRIELSPGKERIEVKVNDRPVKYSKSASYQGMEDKDVAFEIYELPDNSVKIASEIYDISAIYDGLRVQITASDKYRNAVRGLCGNYDGQPDNDFTTPKNCMLKNSEEFSATYALVEDSSCQGPARENALKAEKSVCTRWSNRPSNVISDHEAGRSSTGGWGHHEKRGSKNCNALRTQVVTINDQICFTTRPTPACAPGCSPIGKKTKQYKLYCMPVGQSALETKNRVEKGANPDLSQKPVSMTHPIEVATACAA